MGVPPVSCCFGSSPCFDWNTRAGRPCHYFSLTNTAHTGEPMDTVCPVGINLPVSGSMANTTTESES